MSSFSVIGDREDAPVRAVTALSCSTDGNMVGFSVLNTEESVLGTVSNVPLTFSTELSFSVKVI